MALTPSAAARCEAATAKSIDIRLTPGIVAIGSVLFSPSITKIGQIRLLAEKWVSWTMLRAQLQRRLRLNRVRGKDPVEFELEKSFDRMAFRRRDVA